MLRYRTFMFKRNFFLKSEALLSERGARILSAVVIFTALAFTVWICAFKIMDRDFWWHSKAGEILVREHRWITTEPFAYTREGKPYLATHECWHKSRSTRRTHSGVRRASFCFVQR
jgi:hypothetical protein